MRRDPIQAGRLTRSTPPAWFWGMPRRSPPAEPTPVRCSRGVRKY